MTKTGDPNHGDPDSRRWRGKTIDELPVREREIALGQIIDADRKQKKQDILRRTNRYDPIQLDAAIRQMEGNIKNMQEVISEEHQKIAEYRMLIRQAEARDQELRANGFPILHPPKKPD